MIKILFICHGNICRSPMAEFIFKDMIEKRGLQSQFEISSAATSTEEIWNGKGNPIYPPAQVKAEVGSPVTYVVIICILVAVILAICFIMYQLSKKHPEWVDPQNKFAPFTWEIEGLNKPGKVSSNVPTEIMSKDQNPMGMPIKRHYSPDEQVSSSVFKAAEDNKLTPPDADN